MDGGFYELPKRVPPSLGQSVPMSSPVILAFLPFYLPGYKAGGAIRTVANMVSHTGDKFRFKIFTRDRDFLDSVRFRGVRADEWSCAGKAMVYYCSPEKLSALNVYRILSETGYDILYLNSFFSPRFTILPLLLRRLKLIPRKPAILAPRGEFANSALKLKWYKKRLYLFAARAFDLCGGIIWQASTWREEEDIVTNFGNGKQLPVAEKILIAEDLHAIYDDLPQRAGSVGSGRLRVVFLSRICRMKNLKFALDVLREVKSPISFDIYGPVDDHDYWEDCRRALRRLPGNIKAEYRGPVQNDDVIGILSRYDLFFLPTLGENFGHVIWEAMTAGCPVLISDRTPWLGLREMGVGWDVPLSEIGNFREIIENCANMDEHEYSAWSIKARDYALSKMRSEEAVERNINLFLTALSQDHHPG